MRSNPGFFNKQVSRGTLEQVWSL